MKSSVALAVGLIVGLVIGGGGMFATYQLNLIPTSATSPHLGNTASYVTVSGHGISDKVTCGNYNFCTRNPKSISFVSRIGTFAQTASLDSNGNYSIQLPADTSFNVTIQFSQTGVATGSGSCNAGFFSTTTIDETFNADMNSCS